MAEIAGVQLHQLVEDAQQQDAVGGYDRRADDRRDGRGHGLIEIGRQMTDGRFGGVAQRLEGDGQDLVSFVFEPSAHMKSPEGGPAQVALVGLGLVVVALAEEGAEWHARQFPDVALHVVVELRQHIPPIAADIDDFCLFQQMQDERHHGFVVLKKRPPDLRACGF